MKHLPSAAAALLVTLILTPAAEAATTFALPSDWYSSGWTSGWTASGFVAGPDGALWIAARNTSPNQIGRITVDGSASTFPMPNSFWSGGGIAVGSDGNFWLTGTDNNGAAVVGRITPSGAVTTFPLPGNFSGEGDIAAGSDGNLWFTDISSNQIGRVTPGGTVTTFASGLYNLFCHITAGPDGNLWYIGLHDPNGNEAIARLTPDGAVAIFDFDLTSSRPRFDWCRGNITAGPDGNVWFTGVDNNVDSGAMAIGRIAPNGAVAIFTLPGEHFLVNWDMGDAGAAIAAGPDGNLWFVGTNYTDPSTSVGFTGEIGRITPSGVATFFTLPSGFVIDGYNGMGITTGPDGNLWFIGITAPDGTQRIGHTTSSASRIQSPGPVATTVRRGQSTVKKTAKVKVLNPDNISAHSVKLESHSGCPAGTVGTPDFDATTPGAQDTVTLAAGKSKLASVQLTITSAAFYTPKKTLPIRCVTTFTAITTDQNAEVVPTAASAPLVIDVIDMNDP